MALTTQRFFIVTRPNVRGKVFEEHWAVGSVVAPIVHFTATKRFFFFLKESGKQQKNAI